MHQCLECGHMIGDDDAILVLKPCRACKGTRFYYTESELTDDERNGILKRSRQTVQEAVTEMIKQELPEEVEGEWAELKPKDLRRLVKKVHAKAKEGPTWEYDDVEPVNGETEAEPKHAATGQFTAEEVKARRDELLPETEARPDTVQVGDGNYEIDVKGLLEHNPVVVHRDGAYMIHLPSLFGKKE